MRNFNYSALPRLTPAVGNIIVANVIMYVITLYAESRGTHLATLLGAYYPDSPDFHSWQIISYMFMHSTNLGHIFFNMLGLYYFGVVLENIWGTERFVYFYFLCGIGAYLFQVMIQGIEVHQITGTFHSIYQDGIGLNFDLSQKLNSINSPTVGASGAVFGILVAFGILFPNTELIFLYFPFPVKAKFIVSGYVLLELYSAIVNNPGDHVAHLAHLGGGLVGFLILRIWNSKNYKRFY